MILSTSPFGGSMKKMDWANFLDQFLELSRYSIVRILHNLSESLGCPVHFLP